MKIKHFIESTMNQTIAPFSEGFSSPAGIQLLNVNICTNFFFILPFQWRVSAFFSCFSLHVKSFMRMCNMCRIFFFGKHDEFWELKFAIAKLNWTRNKNHLIWRVFAIKAKQWIEHTHNAILTFICGWKIGRFICHY